MTARQQLIRSINFVSFYTKQLQDREGIISLSTTREDGEALVAEIEQSLAEHQSVVTALTEFFGED